MFKVKNFEDNDDVIIKEQNGAFKVIEYKRDLSVDYEQAQSSYFASEMNVRRRQLLCDVSKSNITVQAGAMQWMLGNVSSTTGIKGAGDFFKSFAWFCNWRRCDKTGIHRRRAFGVGTDIQAHFIVGCR